MRLRDAHEAGWEGQEALDFVTWHNQVEKAFAKHTGLSVDEILGDWPSADYFQDMGDDIEAVVEQLTLDAEEQNPGFLQFLAIAQSEDM